MPRAREGEGAGRALKSGDGYFPSSRGRRQAHAGAAPGVDFVTRQVTHKSMGRVGAKSAACLGVKTHKVQASMSAFGLIADIGDVERFVRG
jgi:hypothetical protein